MTLRPFRFRITLSLAIVFLATITARAQNTLYDSFSKPLIDPTKWMGVQFYDPYMEEAIRQLTPTPNVPGDHRLRLSQRAYAPTADNSGLSAGNLAVGFPNPNNITAVSFTVVPQSLVSKACSTNAAVGGVSAGFGGTFFNPSSSPNGAQGDVVSGITIGNTSNNTGTNLTAFYNLFQCNDPNCGTSTNLGSGALGSVQPKSSNTLTIKWDHPNHQFIYQLNSNAPVAVPYNVGDSFPPGNPYKNLQTVRGVPHCTSSPRPYAFLDSYVDNVYVNP